MLFIFGNYVTCSLALSAMLNKLPNSIFSCFLNKDFFSYGTAYSAIDTDLAVGTPICSYPSSAHCSLKNELNLCPRVSLTLSCCSLCMRLAGKNSVVWLR